MERDLAERNADASGDALNEDLLRREEPPVAFEHDCREGICGRLQDETR